MGDGKLRILINPAGRSGRAPALAEPALEVLRRGGRALEVVHTRSAAHLTDSAGEAVALGREGVVVCGGDGSMLAAVGALVGSSVPLGILPLGTGNDFAAGLGIPADARLAAAAIVRGGVATVDVGSVAPLGGTGPVRHFNCVLGVGLDADAIRHLRAAPYLTGNIKYAYGGLRALCGYRPRTVRIAADRFAYRGAVMFAAVANTPTYGGGMRIAPDARLDDGLLNLCVVGGLSRLRMLMLFPRVYRGTHVNHSAVTSASTAELTIEADEALPVCLDGEFTDLVTPVVVRSRPAALAVFR